MAHTDKGCAHSRVVNRRVCACVMVVIGCHNDGAGKQIAADMPKFSTKSRSKLETCHPEIQQVFNKVVQVADCSILEGHRRKKRQDALFASEQSKVEWPKSYHNRDPSDAVDAIPWPIDWSFEKELLWAVQRGDRKAVKRIMHSIQRWAMFIGYVLGVADEMGIRLVSGADWDRDWDLADQNFDDWPHFQLEE